MSSRTPATFQVGMLVNAQLLGEREASQCCLHIIDCMKSVTADLMTIACTDKCLVRCQAPFEV